MTIRASCNFCTWASVHKDEHGRTDKWECVVCRATCERDGK